MLGTIILACGKTPLVVFVFALGFAASAPMAAGRFQTAARKKKPAEVIARLGQEGKDIFGSNCQKCHGPLGKGDGPDSTRVSRLPTLPMSSTRTQSEGLYYKIMNGHPPAMPA
jgi:mono/diheme cytochrome c family protein